MKFAILIWVTLAAYVSSQKLNGRSARALVRRTELLAGPCDEDDIIYKNHCYLFVTDKQTHDTAKAMCEEHGYGLASISSEDERQFLKNTIQADSSLSGNVYWVGATRVDGVWTWDSGEEFVDSYWGGGQPISTKLRDCAYIYPQKFKLSNRKRCNKFTARYICERDQGEPPSKLASVSHIGSCEGGEFRHGDHCYTVSTSKRNLDGAYSTCEQMGYYLAGANTVDELNFVRGLGSDDGNNDIWIGGVSMPGYGGFEWLSGGTWLRESWGDTGSPKVKQAEMACSSMRRKKDYYLRKNKCSKKYTYICERSIPYRMRACEGEDLNLQCEEGAINIIEANFGRTAGNNVCPSSNIQNQDCWNEVSLAKVQEFCEGKTQCIVPATTDVFGEPCAGTDKYLDVIYRCGSGKASPERRTPIATDGCKCIAWGDPHYLTCDGLKHDFQGNCTYTTFLDQLHPDPYFEVKAKNSFAENRKNPVSFQEKITVHVKHPLYTRSHTFQFFRNRTVNMDGLPVTPPISPENDLLLDTIGMGVILTTGYGFWMTYDFEHRTEMRAPPEYANMIGGMCGNCDGNRHNDYVMPDGSQASSAYELGNSWKAGTSCPDVVDDLPECDAAIMSWYSQSDQCGMIKDPLGIFADCISALDPALVTEHFDTCMFDMCYLGDDADLCDNIGALYDDCLLNGVEIPTFRTSSFCALECPNNSIYNPSMPPCQNSCVDPTAASACLDPLAEGCECEEGFVRSGLECVPLADCGCFGLDGSYHKKGDTWVSSDCRQFCTCTGDGDSECEEIPCDEHSICVTIGGTRQCECAPGYIGDGETCEQQDSPDTEQCPAVGETTACSSVDGQCKGICGPDETLALNTLLCPEGCYCCHQRTDLCNDNFGAFCASECDDSMVAIDDPVLCEGWPSHENRKCCKPKRIPGIGFYNPLPIDENGVAILPPLLPEDMPSPGAGVGYGPPGEGTWRDNFAFSGEIIAGIIIPEFSLGGKGGGPGEQGDPLVTTGDGFRYKLLGKPCEYIMFQEDSATPSFRVITNHVGGTVFGEEASFVGSVKVEYNGQVVELLEGNVIKVDAVDVTADLTVDYASFDGISLRWNNHVQKFVTVDIGPGLFEIVWNGYKGHVLVHPSADFSKQVTGLLGNFNEDQLDDLQYKDNGVWKTLTLDASSEDMAAFASGWLLDPNSCS